MLHKSMQELCKEYGILPTQIKQNSIKLFLYSDGDELLNSQIISCKSFPSILNELVNIICKFKPAKVLIIANGYSVEEIGESFHYYKLKELLNVIDVELYDCLIFNNKEYFSFATNGAFRLI